MKEARNGAARTGATPDRAGAEPARPRTKRRRDWLPTALALCVWLCTLPIVFLLIAPWLGVRVGVVTAVVLLVAIWVACRALCAPRRMGPDPSARKREP